MIPKLILASTSPRRKELLALLVIPFEVVGSPFKEPPVPDRPVNLAELVRHLAFEKAKPIAEKAAEGLVIGSDTLVTLSHTEVGVPLGKPRSIDEARDMLRQLSGNTHAVYTGVALIEAGTGRHEVVACRTLVTFRTLNEAMIQSYLLTGESMDKAGAYGSQGFAAPFIERFDGDFYNVMGLPLCTLGKMLERMGYEWYDRTP